jgi:hypothetical protein
MNRYVRPLLVLVLGAGLAMSPAAADWHYGGSYGNVPDASPPERVDDGSSDDSSDDSYDYDAAAREEARQEAAREAAERRQAAREEAARRAAERQEEARREAARRDAARAEAARQEAARREAARAEAAREDAARRAAAERQRQEAEGRRTGFGPYIRTVHVPLPKPSEMNFQREAEISSRRSPVITLSPGTYAVLGSIGKTLKDVPQKIGEAVLTYAGGRAGVANSEEYLSILNVNKGMADDAVSQMQTAVRLMGRGYPEPETTEFLNSSSSRGLRVLVSNLSDVPEHAIVLAPADEEELEREGRGFWEWATGRR